MTAKCKVGLVLEGGGMRGAFTAGVLDYFLDKNLSFHTCIGVSAGACHACSFLSKQKRRGFETNTDYLEDEAYCSFKNLIKTGDLFGVDMCYRKIPEELNPYDYQAFSNNPTEFYVTVTNCKTGEAEYKKITDMHRGIHYVRASSSLPLLSRTVWIKNTPYLDGGIADSIPVKQSEKLGNDKQVVVLTRQRGYRKEPNKAMPAAYLRYRREFPKLVARMKNRHLDYNAALDYLYEEEKKGNVFIICPEKPVEIGRIEKNREKLEHLYEEGYTTAEKTGSALLDFMK
ncbi:MAG TPA: patatin family protein [Candidatus Blautia stercoravium]|nr:patatin family protein [Candidatus Blautia stercoravium]